MCPRFWPLAPLQGPPWGMNPGVCSFGISEDSSRYPNSKYECSMRSESQDKRIWKTLTQYYKGVLDSDP